jgi:NAD+ kinase
MIRKVGIISKPQKENIAAVVPRLLEWLRAHNLEVFYDQETAACIATGGSAVPREELPAKSDMIILLGGDGTLLAAGRMMGDSTVPILPVNLGGLGFLTSVTLEELYSVLEEVLAGNHRISERGMLEAEVLRDGKVFETHRALNDAVLNKAALARIIDLELLIDGGYVCSYKADGLIVSTPTGSTAYSLAAGGPIVYPVLDAFVITPICPHSLTNRPLVVPDTMRIEIDFHCGDESVFLTIDGQVGIELKEGDRVAIRKAPTKLRVVRPVKKTYFQILRNKLKWGGR